MGAAFDHLGEQAQPWYHFKQCLTLFRCKPKEFLRRIVTVDEIWIHWYTWGTKKQSNLWTSPGEHVPKKAKIVQSAGKVIDTVFWDSRGMIYIDYTEEGETATRLHYDKFLGQIAEKTAPFGEGKVLFHPDNAPARISAVAMAKLVKLGYELLPHLPYDLMGLPFVSKLEQVIHEVEICVQLQIYVADLQKEVNAAVHNLRPVCRIRPTKKINQARHRVAKYLL